HPQSARQAERDHATDDGGHRPGPGRPAPGAQGADPELFNKHAQFFTEEVRLWAEETLGATTDRRWRGIFGVSNGGLFAIAMTVQYPDLYGFVFPFSAGAGSGFERSFVVEEETIQLPLFVYSTAGTLEPVFLETTREFAEAYETAGATVEFSQNVAGHDDAVWQIEFVNAVRWLFEQEVE
ncbi:MAG: esterase family protein, partial [Chloroflexi bacterium]|nr:esterase family protein [Chloroflexota bacterium]